MSLKLLTKGKMKTIVLKCYENLNKKFGKKQIFLKMFLFEMKEGDILGFIGPMEQERQQLIKLICRTSKYNRRQC